MSFFPLYTLDRSFTPIFRLLDEIESHSREAQVSHCRRQQPVRVFNPRFDVRETEAAYELHGELPGVDRDHIEIEFTDPQTLVIRGRIERAEAAAPAAPVDHEAESNASEKEADQAAPAPAAPSHQATVEDDFEDVSAEQFTPTETPKTQATEPVKQAEQPSQEKPQARAEKYWVSERSVGQFSRRFHFPSRVDQDLVTAHLDNGVLAVAVPKAKKHEARRITVN